MSTIEIACWIVCVVSVALICFTKKILFWIPLIGGALFHMRETCYWHGYYDFTESGKMLLVIIASFIVFSLIRAAIKKKVQSVKQNKEANKGLEKLTIYNKALELSKSTRHSDIKRAIDMFESLDGWKDSSERIASLKQYLSEK